MNDSACHELPLECPVRQLVLRDLGAARIARWCGTGEAAIYQWLHRGTPDAPVPAVRVPTIAQGAAAEGLDFDLGVLWPAMRGVRAKSFGQGGPADTQAGAA